MVGLPCVPAAGSSGGKAGDGGGLGQGLLLDGERSSKLDEFPCLLPRL